MTGVPETGEAHSFFSDYRSYSSSGIAHITAEAVLEAQKQALELVVQGAPTDEVLRNLTGVVEDAADGDAFAAILIRDSEGHLRTACAPSLPGDFALATDALSATGVLGVAASTNVTSVTQDIAADPHWSAMAPLMDRLGLTAAWSHPIVTRENRVLGVFATFFRERRRPSALELRLVETLAQTAALAIARHDSEAIMARQRRTLDLAMEAAQMGAWRYTLADNICMYDERAQKLYGLADSRFLQDEDGVKRLIHPDDLGMMWTAVSIAADPLGEGRYEVEYRVRQQDGSWRWVSAWGLAEFEGVGPVRRAVAIAGASRDIADIKRAEERLRLLVNELSHRVKNTLATVQSIAMQALRNATDPEAARIAFEARIGSLAKAHDLLTMTDWDGAGLRDVVEQAIQPFAPARFDVTGANMQVSPKHALAFCMAIHELATNAVKHGALAVTLGRVKIAWTVENEHLAFNWREVGGPPVKTPTRRGFGTRLLERAIAHDLGGATYLHYAPDGVRWSATVPPGHA
jgi:two-component sensor histidine kinase/PAS domain-containing protein